MGRVEMFGAFQLLENLSSQLRQEVTVECVKSLFLHIDLIHRFDKPFLLRIACKLIGSVYSSKEPIVLRNRTYNKFFLIAYGNVDIYMDLNFLEYRSPELSPETN